MILHTINKHRVIRRFVPPSVCKECGSTIVLLMIGMYETGVIQCTKNPYHYRADFVPVEQGGTRRIFSENFHLKGNSYNNWFECFFHSFWVKGNEFPTWHDGIVNYDDLIVGKEKPLNENW